MAKTYQWCAGAESDGANSYLTELIAVTQGGALNSGTFTSPTTRPKTGARHFRCSAAGGQTYGYAYCTKPITATRQGQLGVWIYTDTTGAYAAKDAGILAFLGAANDISLRFPKSSTSLGLYVNGAAWEAAAAATWAVAPVAAYRHLVIDFKVHSSAGWARVWIDGVQVLTFTGNTGDEDVSSLIIGQNNTAGAGTAGYGGNGIIDFDDFTFYDTTGEAMPATCPMSSYRYGWFEFTEDGSKAEFTCSTGADHFANIDDIPHTDDTDYNYAGAAGLEDSFAHAAFTRLSGYSVTAVIPAMVAKRTDGAIASTIKAYALNNGDEGVGETVSLTTYYQTITGSRILVDPDTAAAWDDAGINTAEFGYQSAGVYV